MKCRWCSPRAQPSRRFRAPWLLARPLSGRSPQPYSASGKPRTKGILLQPRILGQLLDKVVLYVYLAQHGRSTVSRNSQTIGSVESVATCIVACIPQDWTMTHDLTNDTRDNIIGSSGHCQSSSVKTAGSRVVQLVIVHQKAVTGDRQPSQRSS